MASERNLNMENANRGILLVKLPKSIAKRWETCQNDAEVGKFEMIGSGANRKLTLILKDVKETKTYNLEEKNFMEQTYAIFSKSPEQSFAIEGQVTQRLDCKPDIDMSYMSHKVSELQKVEHPVRQLITIDNIDPEIALQSHQQRINVHTPIKTPTIKNLRKDKEVVVKMITEAFEKHQYYAFSDLVKIIKQPAPYLKKILNEYCNYNSKFPNKNMWELKPEFRCYQIE